MAMTGKYAGGDAVEVTQAIEDALTQRFEPGTAYDSGSDVEFHCCEDGIVIDVPVTGWLKSRNPLNFKLSTLERGSKPFLADLKTIHDGGTPTGTREATVQAIFDAL